MIEALTNVYTTWDLVIIRKGFISILNLNRSPFSSIFCLTPIKWQTFRESYLLEKIIFNLNKMKGFVTRERVQKILI